MRTTTGSLSLRDSHWRLLLESLWGLMFSSSTSRTCCLLKLLWLLKQGIHGLTARSWNCQVVAGECCRDYGVCCFFERSKCDLEWTLVNGFCRYEFQMQYGSIGWSVGATLGYAQAVPEKRVIACIGDGSFQVFMDPIFLCTWCLTLDWLVTDYWFS